MPLTAVYNHPELFQHADVIAFVDNISALIGCIKGSSRVEDSTAIAGCMHVCFAAVSARVHFEWAPSRSNPSDGVSRRGPNDPLARLLRWKFHPAKLPPWQPNVHGIQLAVQQVLINPLGRGRCHQ